MLKGKKKMSPMLWLVSTSLSGLSLCTCRFHVSPRDYASAECSRRKIEQVWGDHSQLPHVGARDYASAECTVAEKIRVTT